jgi:hypothetical protein
MRTVLLPGDPNITTDILAKHDAGQDAATIAAAYDPFHKITPQVVANVLAEYRRPPMPHKTERDALTARLRANSPLGRLSHKEAHTVVSWLLDNGHIVKSP